MVTLKGRQLRSPGFLFLLALAVRGAREARPHIVVLMADDLGWNDVSFRQGAASDMYTPNIDRLSREGAASDMYTPNIDRLSREGVNINNAYMMQMCTPSRAAFLTGVYPFRYGMQHYVLEAMNNGSMPLDKMVFPERLRELGYRNYLVGKWHLGFCDSSMTPTGRGFHHFYGMYNGVADYFTHVSKRGAYDLTEETLQPTGLVDRRPAWEANGIYSTDVFTNKAIEILQVHDKSQPLFLWLSYQATHGPLQVPESYVSDHCASVDTSLDGGKRRLKCGVTAALDEGVGRVRAALDDLGYSDNLLTLFLSDNGGPTSEGSSNEPLRGSKTTLWEGGVRVPLILHSKKYFGGQYLANNSASWDGTIHAVDWYPTLMSAAGDTTGVSNIDGENYWTHILTGNCSAREWTVVNINEVKQEAAIRYGDYKLHRTGTVPERGADDSGLINVTYRLYNTRSDPQEAVNLNKKADKQAVVRTMQTRLWQEMGQLQPANQYQDVEDPLNNGGVWSPGQC